MLNPFDQKMADAFEVNAFLKGTRFACLEVSPPPSNPVLTLAPNPSPSPYSPLALTLTLTRSPPPSSRPA